MSDGKKNDPAMTTSVKQQTENLKDLKKKGTLVGTEDYIAPEILALEQSGPPADIWSFGVILFMMLSGLSPFKTQNKT